MRRARSRPGSAWRQFAAMSLRQGLQQLGRGLAQGAKALPERGGAGAPLKLAPRPDKPVGAEPSIARPSSGRRTRIASRAGPC